MAVAEDCHGVTVFAEGRVFMAGTKGVRGIRTGNPDEPIAPVSWEPGFATLRVEVALGERFRIFDAGYACWEDLVVPETEGDCSSARTLGENAACLVALFAHNGMHQGQGNFVLDTARVNAEPVSLEGLPLHPVFSQSAFDESFRVHGKPGGDHFG